MLVRRWIKRREDQAIVPPGGSEEVGAREEVDQEKGGSDDCPAWVEGVVK